MASNTQILIKTTSFEQGWLLKRYKRFLTDVKLASGELVTAHCPNTGSMRNCLFEGEQVWLSRSDNPKRKLAYTWEWAQNPQGQMIGIHSAHANKWVEAAIEGGLIEPLSGFATLKREQKYGEHNSRIDLLLSDPQLGTCYVEVKSATLLLDDGQGVFPDTTSVRAVKHVEELIAMVQQGHRAAMVWCVQHQGINRVGPAYDIHPEYAEACERARAAGVEFYAVKAVYDGEDVLVTNKVTCWPN